MNAERKRWDRAEIHKQGLKRTAKAAAEGRGKWGQERLRWEAEPQQVKEGLQMQSRTPPGQSLLLT